MTAIFHGRDIFSPSGAHLAAGVPLTKLGTPIDDMVRYHINEPQIVDGGIDGEIIHIDHFGNILTNIPREILEEIRPVSVQIADQTIDGMVNTFGERPVGNLIALYCPHYRLMVSVVNGNAAARLHPQVGDKIVVRAKI